MTIVKEVDVQLNDLNKAFPVMAKAWESKLPAINMYAISVAPRGEDGAKEATNGLFFDEHFGEEETPAWWRISGKAHVAPKCKAMPKSSAGSEQQGVPPSASSSSDTTGRAPWWASYQPTGKERDDGSVVNHTIQATWKFPRKGKTTDRWAMPERHDANGSFTIIEQCTAFGNLNIGVSFVVRRESGVVVPTTKFGPEVNAGKRASYWERYLRHLVTTLLIFDKKRRADRIINAYLNKPNLAWLQLYAYICAKTGCLYRQPGATPLKALIDGHDNPDTANRKSSRGTVMRGVLNSPASNCAMSRRQPSPMLKPSRPRAEIG